MRNFEVIDTFVHGALLSLWRSWYLLNKRAVDIHIPSVPRRTCSQVVPSDHWAPGSWALVQIDSKRFAGFSRLTSFVFDRCRLGNEAQQNGSTRPFDSIVHDCITVKLISNSIHACAVCGHRWAKSKLQSMVRAQIQTLSNAPFQLQRGI